MGMNWISVKTAMPGYDERVLFWTVGGEFETGAWTTVDDGVKRDEVWEGDSSYYQPDEVTHWMRVERPV